MTQTTETTRVSVLPRASTLQLKPSDRALGRLTNIDLHSRPEGQAQEDLAGDVFYELYQADPQSRPEVPAERVVNRKMLDWMKGTHGWEKGRASTIGNLPAGLAAASFMWANLTSDEAMQEALKEQEKAEEAAQQARTAQAQADAASAAADAMRATGQHDEAERMATQAQALMEEAGRAEQEAKAAAQRAEAAIDDKAGKPLQQAKMMAAAADMADKAKETAEAVAGWGMGPGDPIHTDPDAALMFLKHNQGKIAQIARLAGRLRGIALQARMSRTPRGLTPAGAGLTHDLMRVFPTELALLRPDAPDVLRAEKLAQLVESGLLGYRPAGDAEKRGPFVGAVDVSPSMRGPREVIAKAVALGLAQAAKADGREYILFSFASDTDNMLTVHSGDEWLAHLRWASTTISGGTDFDMAIGKAMELLSGIDRADCMFISDGEAPVAQETVQDWAQFQAQTGARMFYVPVGYGGYIDIEDVADRVVKLADLDEQAGTDLAAELGAWL